MKNKWTRILMPEWPAPTNVRAYSTLRYGPDASGYSRIPYDRFNLAMHVGDDENNVKRNRELLKQDLELPSDPFWLEQTHSARVVKAGKGESDNIADASYTTEKNVVCAVLTADCLPILICDKTGTTVAVIHAGWRGLLEGVITSTIAEMDRPGDELLAWLGPAIGPEAFEVGGDIRDRYIDVHRDYIKAFAQRPGRKWHANIYQLAAIQLFQANVNSISGGRWCTYLNQENFFSYRRDRDTGRMATLIWLQ